jgi:hypothetical protein
MPRHRGLNLKRFLFNVPLHLFQQYFKQVTVEGDPDSTMFAAMKEVEAWLDAPDNREASGVVLEEWGRIFDICVNDGAHLFRAFERSKVPCDRDRPIEELAMRLFLEDQNAFEYAWSYYLLHASQARVSQYHFPAGELTPQPDQVKAMESYLGRMFDQQKKGAACHVRANRDESGVIILVSRGAYMRTVMQWQGTRVVFRTFRPAVEDVMTYEPDSERLSVRPGFNRDRPLYVHAIAQFLAEDDRLADKALSARMFNLERIQNGQFSYKGNNVISRVRLREAHLQLPALGEPTLVIKSDDVVRTLAEDLRGVSLSMGQLKRVKLLFDLQFNLNTKPEPVVFEIEPPAFSNLSLKRHSEHIEAYLRAQGVKLV